MRNKGQSMKCMMIAAVLGQMLVVAGPATAKPLKVFVLAGQSNMQGNVNVSTFDYMADDPKTAPILKDMRDADGKPCVCQQVWISSIGCAGDDTTEQPGKVTVGYGAQKNFIGPEFTFGIYMEKLLGQPMLFIKTSWGGKSLHTDFRPPSAGPETINDYILSQWKERKLDVDQESAKVLKNCGVYYRLMIEHVQKVLADLKRVVPDYDPKQGYELAGFVWFQGWNDYCDDWTYHNRNKPGGYDQYSQLLAQFIRDVRKDLAAPKLPFVIGIMGVGGLKEDDKPPMSFFRQAQIAPTLLPEFKPNVVAVRTAPFWDDSLDELHRRQDANWPKVDAKVADEFKKHPNLSDEEQWAIKMKFMAEYFTPEEWRRAQNISHWDCHYHGAAKIMAPIGKAFAEAMVRLQKTPSQESP
jgi:hypothetical protein